MPTVTAQVLAGAMTAAHVAVWVLISRWERPGRDAPHRVRLRPPRVIGRGGDLAQVIPLLYPAFVMLAPAWAYGGWLNWSFRLDSILHVVGLTIWAVAMTVLVWTARVLGRHMGVEGVAVDHQLVISGPYRYVRHPVYACFTLIAVGVSLVFRSFVVAGLAVVWVVAAAWWVRAEEQLLASPEGFGEAYLDYKRRTGRFLPRVRRP